MTCGKLTRRRRAWPAVVCLLAACRATVPATTPEPGAVRLPTRYLADRFAVTPVTASGDTLELYTDTGGGTNMLWPRTVQRLGLTVTQEIRGADTIRTVRLPGLTPGSSIPLPAAGQSGDRFFVPPESDFTKHHDGLLGRTWFADRTWRLDYPGRSMTLLPRASAAILASRHRAPLGFQMDSAGRRTTHFPRIRIEVDGDSLDLLFDTGAMVSLTEPALAQLADGGPAERGTNFITQQVFDRWRARHPGWRIIERADQTLDMPMIEVPSIGIAGHRVGPVWFTMRPDRNFHQFMSQWMDRRVDGALGGSALRFFRVTVDYPNAVATFERQ